MKTILLILIFSICNFANTQINAQVCFTPANYSISNDNSTTIACADFNSDGKLDLALAYNFMPTIYILLGDSLGGFGAATIASDSGGIGQFTNLINFISGDFNGDSKADLAITEWAGSSVGYVKILFGDGNSSFPTSDIFPVAAYPTAICSADFNGDGNIDLAAACRGIVSILSGDNTGNFSSRADFFSCSNPTGITIGDFNDNGIIDLALSNSYNGGGPDSVWVFLGDGAGSFGTTVKYLAGSGPNSVCSADFNSDGFDDIAVANNNSNDVSVLISKGSSGTFFDAISYIAGTIPGASSPNSVISADFNLDGKPDLAIANSANKVYIILGTGTGSFDASTFYPAQGGPWAIISVDFNSDGKPDLATAKHDSPNITVLLNCAVAGIDKLNNEQISFIYPNPAVNTTRIDYKLPEGINQGEIIIYDLQGKEIKRYVVNKTTDFLVVSTADIPAGTYFFQLQTTVQNSLGKKMVVIK